VRRPILFSVNFFNAFDVDFVLATLLDGQGSSSQSDSSQSSSQSSSSCTRNLKLTFRSSLSAFALLAVRLSVVSSFSTGSPNVCSPAKQAIGTCHRLCSSPAVPVLLSC
jgi:hypothetical protein